MKIDAVLDVLADGVAAALGDDLVGVYVVGSFALGYGDEHSDLDFLVVTRDRVFGQTEDAVRALHRSLPDEPLAFAKNLEGSYAPLADLASPATVGRRWLYVDNGKREMALSDHDNTVHGRWTLREHGRVVIGPAPATFVHPVTADELRAEAIGVARRVAEWVERDPGALANAWAQPYVVLTMCRVLFTAHEGRVTGKADAATWARERVSKDFGELVARAVAERPDPWGRVHRRADATLAAPTRAFVWDVHRLVGETVLGRSRT